MVPGLQNPATRPAWLREVQNCSDVYGNFGIARPPVGDFQTNVAGNQPQASERSFLPNEEFFEYLLRGFSDPVVRNDGRGFAQNQFAVLGMKLYLKGEKPQDPPRLHDAHMILIQRLASNQFEVYDPAFGVFSYPDLNAMQIGLRNIYRNPYGEDRAAIGLTRTVFYTYQPRGTSALNPPGYPTEPSSGASSGPLVKASGSPFAGCSQATSNLPPNAADTWLNFDTTHHAYSRGVSRSSSTATFNSSEILGSGPGFGPTTPYALGLTSTAVRQVASGATADLLGAVNDIGGYLSDPGRRPPMESMLYANGGRGGAINYIPQDIAGYETQPGGVRIDRDQFLAELREHFSQRRVSSDGTTLETQPMMMASLNFGNANRLHTIAIQHLSPRLNPSSSDENDIYQIYDPTAGVFQYRGFHALTQGINGLFEEGYPGFGGVRSVTTYYYADARSRIGIAGIAPGARPAPTRTIRDVLGQDARQWTIPTDVPHLAPLPDYDQPGPSGWNSGFRELAARSTDQPLKPSLKTVFRPSTVSPDQLKHDGGVYATHTPLGNVNLDLHNQMMSSDPANIDGGGYLATFHDRTTAQAHMAAIGPNGYIYYAAPTPNMVDVRASLGDEHTRSDRSSTGMTISHDSHEAAAMGYIGWTQIRGWQQVTNGKLAEYKTNPDYRWDIFDYTATSRDQPQLARFAADNPAWSDVKHSPFVSPIAVNGKTIYRPNESPELTAARFLDQARAQVEHLELLQQRHEDYRGPVTVKPVWQNANGQGSVKLAFRNGYVSVNGWNDNGTTRFVYGSDGRFHSSSDYTKVIRIDSGGNAYIGAQPGDKNNPNGVFGYRRHAFYGVLMHTQDRKLLTEPRYAYTPYVERPLFQWLAADRIGSVDARQRWILYDSSNHPVTVPLPRSSFTGYRAGGPEELSRFYENPRAALPPGTTHFVTELPGFPSGPFLLYPGAWGPEKKSPATVGKIIDSLSSANAAWLFNDGFIATASGSNRLLVSQIDGRPVWSVTVDPARKKQIASTFSPLTSNYHVPEEVWQRINDESKRFRRLKEQLLAQDPSKRR
ncbi:hypothetical protein PBS_50120 [Paraburkholderia sp. 2C]